MQTSFLVVGIIIVAFIILIYISKAKMKNLPVVADSTDILTLTVQNFSHQTKDKLVLVDFWALWCGPCRMMAPVLNELASELTENAQVGKVNVDEHQSLAQKYQVRGIPTLILFKNGVEINRFVGVKTKAFLLKEINKITK